MRLSKSNMQAENNRIRENKLAVRDTNMIAFKSWSETKSPTEELHLPCEDCGDIASVKSKDAIGHTCYPCSLGSVAIKTESGRNG